MSLPVETIGSNAALAQCASDWASAIALDTEFVRTDTFFARPGLYQLCDGKRIYLVDPLEVDDWEPLVNALEDPRVRILTHAPSEDLELIYTHLGVRPRAIVDSQIAHAFLSEQYAISYQGLVLRWQNVEISKEATRSDWIKRPLTAEQLHYAAEDVRYLLPIFAQLEDELVNLGRQPWMLEETANALRYEPTPPEHYYLQVKGAWRLDEAALIRLQALCSWREREAMRRDQPRGRVIKDDVLLSFARHEHLASNALNDALPRGAVRRFGEELQAIHAEPAREIASQDDLGVPAAPLTPAQAKRVQALREYAREQAETLGMAPELLARKRAIEALYREYLETGALESLAASWRGPLLHDAFLKRLAA
ncbi:MAG: HRDC domain-containing protein [Pseudomonadota bacterium]